MLKMQGLVQSIAFAIFFGMIPLTQFESFDPSGTFSQSRSHITKHSSALYIGMAKVLPIIDVLGYDGQNSSFSSSSSRSDLTPITQKGSHIST